MESTERRRKQERFESHSTRSEEEAGAEEEALEVGAVLVAVEVAQLEVEVGRGTIR